MGVGRLQGLMPGRVQSHPTSALGPELLEERGLYQVCSARLVCSSPPRVQVSLFSLSSTHAPWLLAHKIQSPQEKEALYALTVSSA